MQNPLAALAGRVIILIILAFLPLSTLFGQDEEGCRAREALPRPYARDSAAARMIESRQAALNEAERLFPKRGGRLDWGLALSGGGVRSAYYSIGVMKALYDDWLLDEIDVISSVSGGGFASYWLYTTYGGSGRFGAAAFANERFVRNLCVLQNRGNFFPVKSQLKTLVSSGDTAFRSWERAINRSFGMQDDPRTEDTRSIGEFAPLIREGLAPYFIVNTTVRSKNGPDALGRIENVFELTPDFRGNPVVGRQDWTAETKQEYDRGIATSSAAVRKFRRNLEGFPVPYGARLQLWDGGYSENLGAVALIRRGIRNVIIVDAEHDPHYVFDAYEKLRTMLRENLRIDFGVDAVERFLCQPKKKRGDFSEGYVNTGHARSIDPGGGIDVKIWYIKLSRPKGLFTNAKELAAEFNALAEQGRETDRDRDFRINYGTGLETNCEGANGLPFKPDLFYYRVREYSRTIEKATFWRRLGKLIPALSYNFPQTTTIDQSYKRDQLEAFVALGYLQAKGLRAR
jgi:predicted acylesterase/phospholipase RssA